MTTGMHLLVRFSILAAVKGKLNFAYVILIYMILTPFQLFIDIGFWKLRLHGKNTAPILLDMTWSISQEICYHGPLNKEYEIISDLFEETCGYII